MQDQFGAAAAVAHYFNIYPTHIANPCPQRLCHRLFDGKAAGQPFRPSRAVSLFLRGEEAIGEATARVVRPGGAFLVYQFSPKVRDFIAPHFERIDRGFEWINVPPATLFWAWREAKAEAAE